ncbi:MAG: hypothetical protein NVSMB46_08590 [Candidatus Saccharimonadales bacterium]
MYQLLNFVVREFGYLVGKDRNDHIVGMFKFWFFVPYGLKQASPDAITYHSRFMDFFTDHDR